MLELTFVTRVRVLSFLNSLFFYINTRVFMKRI